ncbi:MAG: hypothetical protein ACYCTE_16475 [Acidimicrobiales bacterium]
MTKKRDGRKNPEHDKPQSIWREGVDPEDALRELLGATMEVSHRERQS